MGAITYCADISKPSLWPLPTLEEAEVLLRKRIGHVNTKPSNRDDAVRRLGLVLQAIESKKPPKKR